MAMKFFGKKRPPGLHRDAGFPVMSDTAYRAVLDGIETARKPQWYLEIGSRSGGSLRHRKCNFIAIDPEFAPGADVLSRVSRMHFFQMTSDAFFEADFIRRNDLKVDFAFIDGMHLFEYALRDFMNCEANAMPSGVIALHDVCPFNHAMTTRDLGYLAASAAWTGDVWKVMVILQKYRPDLRIDLLSASKTGLGVVRNLDPENRTLTQAYDAILAEYTDLTLQTHGAERYFADLQLAHPAAFMSSLA